MDPVSQGALGAGLASAGDQGGRIRQAALLGALAGMAPDLDVLIASPSDPLLFLEFHRQFTHSLVFVPFGALVCAVALRWLARSLRFAEVYLFCVLGYATHALLDACTSYGTQLFWPFTNLRVAWNNVSVVDPLFTVPLLGLVLATVIRRRPLWARLGLIWAIAYLALGWVQHQRAEDVGAALAASRGHVPERLTAKPGFANLLLWKVVYEADGRLFVDALRLGTAPTVYEGASVRRLDVSRDLPWLDSASQQAQDLERFRWFSDDFLAIAVGRDDAVRVVDMRYSLLPNQIEAMWGIDLDPLAATDAHVGWFEARSLSPEDRQLWMSMLAGREAQPAP